MADKKKGERTPKVIPPIPDTFENVVKAVVQPAPKPKDKKAKARKPVPHGGGK